MNIRKIVTVAELVLADGGRPMPRVGKARAAVSPAPAMSEDWSFRAFEEAEHRMRIERARAILATAGLDGCVCTSPELIYYFTGYEAHTHHAIGSQAMVLATAGKDPVLILRDGDVPQVALHRNKAPAQRFHPGLRLLEIGEV